MTTVPHRIPATHDSAAPPPVLLPYQQAWVADESQLKISEKSRRTGLTWAEASDDVLIAASSKAAGGQNVYYIGYNQDMAIEYVEACAMWARVFNRAASAVEEGVWEENAEDKHIKTYTIRFPDSGHRIVALSSRPANLRGKQGVVVIDEAAFHDKLDELLKAALALLIWGGKVRVISTHNGDKNPFNELINEIRAGKRAGTVQRIAFKEAVEQGLYRRVCLRLGKAWVQEEQESWVKGVYAFYGEAATEELDVVPSQGSGAWLSRALIEERMSPEYPVIRLSKPDDFKHWPPHLREAEIRDWCESELAPLLGKLSSDCLISVGEDFGRVSDLTVIVPMLVAHDLVRHAPFIVELLNMPFEQQRQILFFICDRLARFHVGALDARGNGAYLAEVAAQRYGARIREVQFTESWYREHMPALKAAFEDGTILIPKDAHTQDDLRAIRLVDGVARLPKSTGQKNRHGDSAIAIALAHYATRQDGVEIEFSSTGRRRLGYEGGRTSTDVGWGVVGGSLDTGGF